MPCQNKNNKILCAHCAKEILLTESMGTKNRNHCPFCLFSKHVDNQTGDRKSSCQGLMAPIGLSFKQEGIDKYGRQKQGEIMLVHQCQKCGKISLNRIAADDKEKEIIEVFYQSFLMPTEKKQELQSKKINLIGKEEKEKLEKSLFGS